MALGAGLVWCLLRPMKEPAALVVSASEPEAAAEPALAKPVMPVNFGRHRGRWSKIRSGYETEHRQRRRRVEAFVKETEGE